jgi:serine/threonine protein kinase
MTVTQTMQCPRCGTVRAAGAAPLDLCPACLLATALSMSDDPCPYRVLTPIGEGSNGVTYLAERLAGVGGYVALKMFAPRDDVDAVVSRYQQWQPALARVRHPSVGKLLGVGVTADGRLYVASDYVAGWPLTALSSHEPMDGDQRRDIGRQLTGALDAIHAAGIVHLKLNSSKVKISTANGPQATILGLGSAVVVDGAEGSRDVDRTALARIVRQLGLDP